MVDLKEYRENARRNNLCAEYSQIWDSCKSGKQLADMAFGAKGADYICDTIAKGWGISPDYICSNYSSFINGKYISQQKGYTSKMYCKYNGDITADTTLIILIDCEANLLLPDVGISEVYCTGKCNISVSGNGRSVFICYGNPDDISITGQSCNFKRINKKERDHYA